MKITGIKSQGNNSLLFSILIDNKYAFSLSQVEISKHRLKIGQKIEASELKQLRLVAGQDKLYIQTLKLVAARSKSEWEVRAYLNRKGASPTLIDNILNKLSNLGLVDDNKYAELLVRDILLRSPASRRKILNKLRAKHVSEEIIAKALESDEVNDATALKRLIEQKQTKYKDRSKLMAYLARQGFNYGDIKDTLNNLEDN